MGEDGGEARVGGAEGAGGVGVEALGQTASMTGPVEGWGLKFSRALKEDGLRPLFARAALTRT